MDNPETKTLPVPVPLLQQIVSYLQEQPWKESNPFLVGIDQLARAQMQPEAQEPTPKTPARNGKNRVKELAK